MITSQNMPQHPTLTLPSMPLLLAVVVLFMGCDPTLERVPVGGSSVSQNSSSKNETQPADSPTESSPTTTTEAAATETPAVGTVVAEPEQSAEDSALNEPGSEIKTPAANPALQANRTFRVEGPDDALRITYDDLDLKNVIGMDPVTADCVEQMPKWLRDLDGKTIRLRGYMKPFELSEGIRRFVFVRDTQLCCFGPIDAKVYHLINVTLKKGTSTDLINLTPFDVVGTFRIAVEYDEGLGGIYELYHIDDAKIIRK